MNKLHEGQSDPSICSFYVNFLLRWVGLTSPFWIILLFWTLLTCSSLSWRIAWQNLIFWQHLLFPDIYRQESWIVKPYSPSLHCVRPGLLGNCHRRGRLHAAPAVKYFHFLIKFHKLLLRDAVLGMQATLVTEETNSSQQQFLSDSDFLFLSSGPELRALGHWTRVGMLRCNSVIENFEIHRDSSFALLPPLSHSHSVLFRPNCA